jgi:2',3'-cyclic-nucleotide 2'-phosphodiesterase (5'-nucleotidase family)
MTPKFRLLIGITCILFTYVSCSKTYHLADIKADKYRIEKASYAIDEEVAALIQPYKAQLDETMNEVIAISDVELVKNRPNGTLNNWFADVLLSETQNLVTDKIDFAIQNYGGIRIPTLPKGNITVGKIYELMPFDNIMYVMELKGSDVQKLCDKIAESGGWPVSHTLALEISYGKAVNVTLHGVPLDTTKTYVGAIPDYLANGGDNLSFLKECTTHNTGALIRDLLISHARVLSSTGKHIVPNSELRIN